MTNTIAPTSIEPAPTSFPPTFTRGAGTSAWSERAPDEGGQGPSIRNTFCRQPGLTATARQAGASLGSHSSWSPNDDFKWPSGARLVHVRQVTLKRTLKASADRSIDPGINRYGSRWDVMCAGHVPHASSRAEPVRTYAGINRVVIGINGGAVA
ncbi:hypothetical protein [Deinococcus hopiensis]|uniref:Uncharacterized protein n=1 Tax=Deinococcus hopiensis KR-140 TaxID=695939 RepID=A0A1W1UDD2_9DEIO|nr:hypothetical protein [Deinococcus hopiensis]SMB79069.1 hypothetical protein SAMN00790413_05747 [Deinococcus hopiensis KR-140]